ncbi:MAG TPA: DUF1501 domain-containing protein [Thermoanaerobaculia bacterium]|nr:DUF1501 domain-containing protein [Thermoanaerobaculia bacterium]
MPVSRRDFLLKSAGFVTVSAMVPRWSLAGARRFEESVGATAANRTLIVLELMGGNDGLNTVVPYADNAYPTVRSRIGIPASSVLSLDGNLGLNPVMSGLKALWDAKRVALVEGVGYPNSSLSHFTSRDIWHTADPALAQDRGWLGRWLDAYVGSSANPLVCTAVSNSLPRTLLADNVSVPSLVSLASYAYPADGAYPGDKSNQVNAFVAEAADQFEIENTTERVSVLSGLAITSSGILQTVGSGYVAGGAYPSGSLGSGLQLIAQIIHADLGTRILYITYGGFDNHAGEDKDHDPLLQTVSDGIKALFDDLDAHGKSHDVLLMTWSEFGRRVQDNASNGTDHGTAAPHFVVGDAVNAGIYGTAPSLTSLDANGNLLIENDFRSYYGTVLSDWLGADASAILGASWPNLGFVNKSYS